MFPKHLCFQNTYASKTLAHDPAPKQKKIFFCPELKAKKKYLFLIGEIWCPALFHCLILGFLKKTYKFCQNKAIIIISSINSMNLKFKFVFIKKVKITFSVKK